MSGPVREGGEGRSEARLVQFLEVVPAEGYVWEKQHPVGDTAGPWLVGRVPQGKGDNDALCEDALTRPGLHRRFVRLKPTPHAFVQFANRLGPLDRLHHTFQDADGVLRVAEPFTLWWRTHARLRFWLVIWDLVRQRDHGKLGQLVHRDGERVWVTLAVDTRTARFSLEASLALWRVLAAAAREKGVAPTLIGEQEGGEGLVFGPDSTAMEQVAQHCGGSFAGFWVLAPPRVARHWPADDVLEPAHWALCDHVNRVLAGHMAPVLVPWQGRGDIVFVPDSLLAALYVHFMLEVSGRGRPAILCAQPRCGRYFNPTHGRQRYCSDQCRWLVADENRRRRTRRV